MKYLRKILLLLIIPVILSSCGSPPEPEKLPLSVRANLNLLQKDPQFVMYMNFKSMRSTKFWEGNLSDSILSAEQNFGSILNTFGRATGVTISNGLDELYYSNSWFGDNSIILKGVFDKGKLDSYVESDSNYTTTTAENGTIIYQNIEQSLYFFFKDNFTLCASNYLSRVNEMMGIQDTSQTGLVTNEAVMKAVESTLYKKDLWMVSTERMFIRGVLLNFFDSKSLTGSGEEEGFEGAPESPEEENPDDGESLDVDNLYERVSSLSFSIKMDENLKLVVQPVCVSERSAAYMEKIIGGLLTISRLSSSLKGDKEKTAIEEILKSIEVERYDSTIYIDINITKDNLKEFQERQFLDEPK